MREEGGEEEDDDERKEEIQKRGEKHGKEEGEWEGGRPERKADGRGDKCGKGARVVVGWGGGLKGAGEETGGLEEEVEGAACCRRSS